ncbi:prepilin peptidase [Aeromicrobium duanguangcaii]|uniref:A24 family peptidase n=1 Tax=Aeromicrobium duanguangcaii TaxID=2968086 RepID=A0ABY5KNX7_9ACTN|nr:A24 family peptidase [Aeromicrobium duanguangcaii]MCD9153056.1 A24 family peptidase [Aeromicrobium duanguangcaii]UUI70043.1 A24 family peptidase [Aeromicrobium duanguangcaii]
MTILAIVLAGLLGGISPRLLARLPEPTAEPDPDMPEKIEYAILGATPRLALWLAVTAAALAAIAAATISEPKLLPVWIPIAAATPVLAWVDWKVHLLPYLIVAPLYVVTWLLVGVSALLMQDASVLLHALLGNLAVFGFYFVLGVIGPMGYGDVRLSAVVGVALGPLGVVATFYGVFFGMVIGAIVGLVLVRGRLGTKTPIAFGPYLLLGAFAALWV